MARRDDKGCGYPISEHPAFDYRLTFRGLRGMSKFEQRSRLVLGATDDRGMHVRVNLGNMSRATSESTRAYLKTLKSDTEQFFFVLYLCQTLDHELVHAELGHGLGEPGRKTSKEIRDIEEYWCHEFAEAGQWARSEEEL